MNIKERKISLKAFCKQYALRCKQVLLVGIIFAVLLGGYKGYDIQNKADINEASLTDAQNEIKMIEKSLAQKSKYLKETPQAMIDPNHEGYAFLLFRVSTEALEREKNKSSTMAVSEGIEAVDGSTELASALVEKTPAEKEANQILYYYSTVVKESIDWNPLAEKMEISVTYIPEIIGFAALENFPGYARIGARYKDLEGAEKILQYFTEQLQKGHDAAEEIYGTHEIVLVSEPVSYWRVNSGMFNWLNTRVTEMNNLMNTLDTYKTATASLSSVDTSRGAITKASIKNGIYGFVGGLILYFVVFILWCVAKGKVLSARELNEQYDLAKIAAVPPEDLNEAKGLKKVIHMFGSDYYSNHSVEKSFLLAKENLNALIPNDTEPLGVISDLKKDELKAIVDNIIDGEGHREMVALSNPEKEPGSLAKLRDVKQAVLIARTMTSSYNRLDEILQWLNEHDIAVRGSIVV